MDNHITLLITVFSAAIVALIGLIYRNVISKIDEIKKSLSEGLSTKVDGIEYTVRSKWQEAEYGDLKMIVKELRASNDESHKAIMIELRRVNSVLIQKRPEC